MTDTYSKHAEICAKFYQLTLDEVQVADFALSKSRVVNRQKALFVGGMFDVAAQLSRSLELTVVDYTDEMVEIGKRSVPAAEIRKADLRALPFENEFDVVFVIGRVFTHMIDDSALRESIGSCHRALRPAGKLLADNYETNRIQKTSYFNGEIKCQDADTAIVRRSKTELLSTNPYIVKWEAEYSGRFYGKEFSFADSMSHRAFSRVEFAEHLCAGGFQLLEQGDNFDETSFYTVAVKT